MIFTKFLIFTVSWASWCLRAWPLSLFGASDFLWGGEGGGGEGRKGGRVGRRSDDLHIHTCRWWRWLCHVYFFDSGPHISLFPDCISHVQKVHLLDLAKMYFSDEGGGESRLRWFTHAHLSRPQTGHMFYLGNASSDVKSVCVSCPWMELMSIDCLLLQAFCKISKPGQKREPRKCEW